MNVPLFGRIVLIPVKFLTPRAFLPQRMNKASLESAVFECLMQSSRKHLAQLLSSHGLAYDVVPEAPPADPTELQAETQAAQGAAVVAARRWLDLLILNGGYFVVELAASVLGASVREHNDRLRKYGRALGLSDKVRNVAQTRLTSGAD